MEDLKRLARKALVQDAVAARMEMSASEWEERAKASEAGKIAGEKEVQIVIRLVWGIGCTPVRF